MNAPETLLKKSHAISALQWFQTDFSQTLAGPIARHFPGWPYTREIQELLRRTEAISTVIQGWPGDPISLSGLLEKLTSEGPNLLPLFKRIVLLYRRHRAADTERLLEKTFHLELAVTLEEEVKALDAVTEAEGFLQIEQLRLPRLKDFLPVQYIESAADTHEKLQPRLYDEKFHILQAPSLFLPDMGYFRARCEDRETPLAIAFVDIDDFKSLNTCHTETKVDRNILPRFMQAIEAHLFQHGYAYRQGGDEYLICFPVCPGRCPSAFWTNCAVSWRTFPTRTSRNGPRYPSACASRTRVVRSPTGNCSAERIEPSSLPRRKAKTASHPTAAPDFSVKSWRL